MKHLILSVCCLFVLTAFRVEPQGVVRRISVHVSTSSVVKGKVLSTEADVFFNPADGKMVRHVITPQNFYIISNRFGEAQMYYPEDNTVEQDRNPLFSTEESILNLFLKSNDTDLGFKNLGFTLLDNRFEQDLTITEWAAPISQQKNLSKVEIAVKNYQPIFLAYYGPDGTVARKSYYSNFAQGYNLPQRVTSIQYTGLNDSIVSRTIYTQMQLNENADQNLANFKVPNDCQDQNQRR